MQKRAARPGNKIIWLTGGMLFLTACPQENLDSRPSAQATGSAASVRPKARPSGFASGRPSDLVQSSNYRPDLVFSSVIIDARGLGVKASMSPTLHVGSKEIFPLGGEIDIDYVVNVGLAAYVYGGVELARQSSRAGKTPLLLRARAAQGRAGSGIVLAENDGRDLLRANQRSAMLNSYKLIILLDKS